MNERVDSEEGEDCVLNPASMHSQRTAFCAPPDRIHPLFSGPLLTQHSSVYSHPTLFHSQLFAGLLPATMVSF